MKNSLGYQDQHPSLAQPIATRGKEEPPKEKPMIYPNIHLRGEAAAMCADAHDIDETFTATVEFRVVSKSDRKKTEYSAGGPEVELEAISIDKGESGAVAPEETAEDALDAYRGANAAPAEEDELA